MLTKADKRSCPSCGYTEADAQLHHDHHLCKNASNAPWEKEEATTRRADKPSQELMEMAHEFDEELDRTGVLYLGRNIRMAQFGEQIVRLCAEIAVKNRHKDYSYDCSEDFRKGYELATQHVEEDILRKFGME